MLNSYWITTSQYDYITNSYVNSSMNLQNVADESTVYAYTYIKNYVDNKIDETVINLSQKITYLISYTNKSKISPNSSIIRNNSKKISELASRDTITKHKDHSWFPVAQFDSRTNSYHNIAMNIGVITSYSIDEINKKYYEISKLSDLAYELDSSYLSYYIGNSYIAQNLVSYSITYSKDYFEWQFL